VYFMVLRYFGWIRKGGPLIQRLKERCFGGKRFEPRNEPLPKARSIASAGDKIHNLNYNNNIQ
jgi:hypothetical protein